MKIDLSVLSSQSAVCTEHFYNATTQEREKMQRLKKKKIPNVIITQCSRNDFLLHSTLVPWWSVTVWNLTDHLQYFVIYSQQWPQSTKNGIRYMEFIYKNIYVYKALNKDYKRCKPRTQQDCSTKLRLSGSKKLGASLLWHWNKSF